MNHFFMLNTNFIKTKQKMDEIFKPLIFNDFVDLFEIKTKELVKTISWSNDIDAIRLCLDQQYVSLHKLTSFYSINKNNNKLENGLLGRKRSKMEINSFRDFNLLETQSSTKLIQLSELKEEMIKKPKVYFNIRVLPRKTVIQPDESSKINIEFRENYVNSEVNSDDDTPINISLLPIAQDFKFRADCIRKRIKTILHNFIYEKLSTSIKDEGTDIFLLKLPREFNTNIRYEFTKKILNSTIRELYSFETHKKEDFQKIKHNKDIILKIQNKEFQSLLDKKMKDFYVDYIAEGEYKKIIASIKEKDGKIYEKYFKTHWESFLQFFSAG